jgi:hypothetical protein
MRFAWLRENSDNYVSVKQGCAFSLIKIAYNAVFFVPIVLTFMKTIEYGPAFIAFTAVIVVRLSANLFLNNVLDPEQAERYPFQA